MRLKWLILLSIWLVGSNTIALAETPEQKHEKIKMIPWEEVNLLIPKYTKFTVRDVVTGHEFQVQRRAGSRHADVQPLTKNDTKTMKMIYQGRWSWKRRAIVVIHDNKKIAASMHGMPHGAGALRNNFPGHFCIHFYGSTTHRRNFMDLSHKLMIFKAANQLGLYLQKADPYEVVSAFVAGIKEDDEAIVDLIALEDMDWATTLTEVESVAILGMPMLPEEDLEGQLKLTVPIEIEWHMKGEGRKKVNSEVHLVRFSPNGGWRVDANRFLENNFKK